MTPSRKSRAGVPVLNWHTFEGTEDEARELARLLNDERRHLTREDRAAWVAKLRAKGLSLRAIGDAVGVHFTTVANDLKRGVEDSTPQGEPEPEAPEQEPTYQEPEREPEPVAVPPKVTGLDGKQYPAKRPEPKPAARPKARKKFDGLRARQWSKPPNVLKRALNSSETHRSPR